MREGDPTAIREAARHLPKAELVILADAAHEILRDRDPVRLAALARKQDLCLVCFCAPKACHADIIKRTIEAIGRA